MKITIETKRDEFDNITPYITEFTQPSEEDDGDKFFDESAVLLAAATATCMGCFQNPAVGLTLANISRVIATNMYQHDLNYKKFPDQIMDEASQLTLDNIQKLSDANPDFME